MRAVRRIILLLFLRVDWVKDALGGLGVGGGVGVGGIDYAAAQGARDCRSASSSQIRFHAVCALSSAGEGEDDTTLRIHFWVIGSALYT